MKNKKENKSFWILFFLALFGLSVGVFDNYRELWMSTNGLSTTSISHIISISYIVTVLVLFYFTIKMSASKLKWGICVSLVLNMMTGTLLIYLNGTGNFFFIKFFMFFDIAFSQLILASVYPLLMSLEKSDVLYTKKDMIESLFSKLGFLFVAIFLGKTIFHTVIDYNICLLLSIIFNFLSFFILLPISVESKKKNSFDIKKTLKYFNKNKVLYQFLFVNGLAEIIWGSVLGMPMLLLTNNMGFDSNYASFFILGLGICSSLLSILIVNHFNFKNDNHNLFVKFGVRILFYFLVFITKNEILFLFTLMYLLVFDQPYGFLFSGYFINHIKEEYALFLTTLRYCSSLLGKAIGTFICGVVFHMNLRIFILPALLLGVFHYIFARQLLKKKTNLEG